jgi:superfamily II DNA/RNA helicase
VGRPSDALPLEGVGQYFVNVEREEWKLDTLCDLYELLRENNCKQAVVYVRGRRKVEWLSDKLGERDDIATAVVFAVHGDMGEEERSPVLQEFIRAGTDLPTRLLITDFPLNGIDWGGQHLPFLAIIFDLPTSPKNYLDRAGRLGPVSRKKGAAISFLTGTAGDARSLREIEQFYSMQLDEILSDTDMAGLW